MATLTEKFNEDRKPVNIAYNKLVQDVPALRSTGILKDKIKANKLDAVALPLLILRNELDAMIVISQKIDNNKQPIEQDKIRAEKFLRDTTQKYIDECKNLNAKITGNDAAIQTIYDNEIKDIDVGKGPNKKKGSVVLADVRKDKSILDLTVADKAEYIDFAQLAGKDPLIKELDDKLGKLGVPQAGGARRRKPAKKQQDLIYW